VLSGNNSANNCG